jgi:hypothetical protein
MKAPDEVCSYFADQGVQITSRLEDGYLLLEGTEEALRFLGELFIAQSEFTKDCGFEIAPDGPGSDLFKEGSDTGIYIHRLPCMEKQGMDTDVRQRHN